MSTPDLSAVRWRKSSRSGGSGGQCVEVADLAPVIAAQWRKSSRSDGSGGACVEVADLTAVIAVRDSKNPDGPKLIIDAAAWRILTRRIKAGEHDLA